MFASQRRSVLEWVAAPRDDAGVHVSRVDGSWALVSYVELASHSRRVADALQQRGIGGGHRVLVITDDVCDFIPAFFGALLAGAVPVPTPTPLALATRGRYEDHVIDRWRSAGARVAISRADIAQRLHPGPHLGAVSLETLRAEGVDRAAGTFVGRPGDREAVLQFTSGSTGPPKSVSVSAGALESNIGAIIRWGGWDETGSVGTWLPLYHDMGLVGTLLVPVTLGMNLWSMTPLEFIRRPSRWLEMFTPGRASLTAGPTFAYGYTAARVAEREWAALDLAEWRVAIVAAERVEPAALRRFARAAARSGFAPRVFAPGYGLAENTLVATLLGPRETPGAVRLEDGPLQLGEPVEIAAEGSIMAGDADRGWLVGCGAPIAGVTVRVQDPQGSEVPDGVLGDIVVAGDSLADGYRFKEAAEQPFPQEGHVTGDAGFTWNGELFVVGRLGDSLRVKGKSVFAEDLEARIAAHLGLPPGRMTVALGSDATGNRCVVLLEGVQVGEARLRACLRGAIGRDMRTIVVHGERGAIPRTSSGKPRRHEVFATHGGGSPVSAEPSVPTESTP